MSGKTEAGPLRVVQIGAGEMGRAWLQALGRNDDVVLVGLVDLNRQAADALLAEIFTNEGTGTLVVRDTKALSAAEQGAPEPGGGA